MKSTVTGKHILLIGGEGVGKRKRGIGGRGAAGPKARDLGRANLWEEQPALQDGFTEGVKGRDGFRPWRPQALLFSEAPPLHHIKHIKITHIAY